MRARASSRQFPHRPTVPWRKPRLAERTVRRFTALFAARMFALDAMDAVRTFDPRLRGAALSGRWRFDSVVELDVFSDRLAPLGEHLRALGWRFEASYYEHEDAQHPTFEVDGLLPLVLHVLPCDELLPNARGIDRDELLSEVRYRHRTELTQWCASSAT